ncbi:MAG: cell envelope protein SmpA [Sphingomonadales bacterium 32-68-7]|nr:MAG: cell envelope protein SmpA [Sphingomonadales bacterium 12-68-11]OYX07424.1 MAG: cell envelope protein SmpA [Sphingomonadales bacterium 32-68-7]
MTRLRIGAVLAASMLASGCTAIVNHRGYFADQVLMQSVQPGIDNRQSVERTLGQPSFTSQFGPPVWYYISSNTEEAPFTRPRIFQHSVLAISFDAAGNVVEAKGTGLEQVAQINPEGDKTPTLGRDRTFLEDLFGNIGQVSAGGGGAGAPGGS